MSAVIQYILYLAVLIVLAIPLGAYIKKVMNGEKTFLSKILTPCENAVYKVMRIKKDEQMNWKKYAVSVLIFSPHTPFSALFSRFDNIKKIPRQSVGEFQSRSDKFYTSRPIYDRQHDWDTTDCRFGRSQSSRFRKDHITGFQIKRHLFCVTDKRYLFSVFIFLLKLFL